MSSSVVIVISPVPYWQQPAATWEYYDVPEEFPNDPLKSWMRWVNYPWAYGTPMVPTNLPPE